VVDIVRPEAEKKGLRLHFLAASRRLPFLGNEHYLRVALLHLLRNSIEACSRGDRIEVVVRQAAGGALVRISDTGPGIPRYVLEHIFEPFYATRDGSTGLGLPYVRQIVREHRGDISISSTPGKGVTVELHLPTHLGELRH
jgi:signal transduction histidine kinase